VVQQLMRELDAMKRRMEKIERQAQEQQEVIRKQSETIRRLSGRAQPPANVGATPRPARDVARTAPASVAAAPSAPPTSTPPAEAPSLAKAPEPWSPTQPIPILAGSRAYLNLVRLAHRLRGRRTRT
jgi:TolA-binding protein